MTGRAPLRPPPPAGPKVVVLEELPALVPDGATVGLGGTWLSSRPMAAARELVRVGRRDLRLVALTGSLDVDVLVGAGAVREIAFCFVSLGPFGLAPRFRHAIERGEVAVDEHTGHGLTVALEAASRGVDFMPFHGPVGTSLAPRYPTIASPVSGEPVQIVEARPLDVAVVHADAATPAGHALLASTVGVDVVTARAADRVIVTAEQIVDRLPASGSRYLTASEVTAVVSAPWGSHPLAHAPAYGPDWRALLDYTDAAADADGFAAWLRADLDDDEPARRARLIEPRAATLRAAGGGGRRTVPDQAAP